MKVITVSVAEASRLLGVRLDYAYRLLWDGTLDGAKSEGVWRVKRKSVEEYLKKRNGQRIKPEHEVAHAAA